MFSTTVRQVKGHGGGEQKKNIGCVLGIGGGQKASHEFYSRLNYTVVEKVLRKMKVRLEGCVWRWRAAECESATARALVSAVC